MKLSDKRFLVTGGAGFIGSHLADRLSTVCENIVIADNFSNGRHEWVPEKVETVNIDLKDLSKTTEVMQRGFDIVFHLAARKDANDNDPHAQFAENTTMTHTVLDAARKAGVTQVAYTSSSAVYGEAPRPTSEDYAPLEPISVYGASKLADEGLLSTYAHSHGFTVWNFRFANVVGPRLRGAVVPDFIKKLRNDPKTLTILGNGKQKKSYLHVDDCVDAMFHIISRSEFGNATKSSKRNDRFGDNATRSDNTQYPGEIHTYNIGTRTSTSVDRIAEIVCDVLEVDPELEYTGGKRGWVGDVPQMRLSIEKLSGLGWNPTIESDEAIRQSAEELITEM